MNDFLYFSFGKAKGKSDVKTRGAVCKLTNDTPRLINNNSNISLLENNNCTIFLTVSLNLHKWPKLKVRTY